MELIGLTVQEAAEKLCGKPYKITENCDSLDNSDTRLIVCTREVGGVTELIVSNFKLSVHIDN